MVMRASNGVLNLPGEKLMCETNYGDGQHEHASDDAVLRVTADNTTTDHNKHEQTACSSFCAGNGGTNSVQPCVTVSGEMDGSEHNTPVQAASSSFCTEDGGTNLVQFQQERGTRLNQRLVSPWLATRMDQCQIPHKLNRKGMILATSQCFSTEVVAQPWPCYLLSFVHT
ncbi:hypothetical protein PVAP13_7NG204100 [Panicum virgatum]|nr:hypothetical protein PVAP13_7NG204100 [Panicum virgatum]